MPGLTIDAVARAAIEAAERIAPLIRPTPLVRSDSLSEQFAADIWLKLENTQHTGSFKLRGASNRLLTLDADQLDAGCVVASSGNHGAAVAFAMSQLGVNGVVFVPEQASPAKIAAIREYGAEVRQHGTDGLDTEQYAREYARDHGRFYLSPYNDAAVIAGQGTCGVEIAAELDRLDAAYIAVGGGGLMSGAGSVLRARFPELRLLGCQPRASAVMARSIAAGAIVDVPSEATLSDGTAGGIEADAVTFELCRELIDEFLLIDEASIAAAILQQWSAEQRRIEGAAAVALAALEQQRDQLAGKVAVVIVCGGNISDATFAAVTGAESAGN